MLRSRSFIVRLASYLLISLVAILCLALAAFHTARALRPSTLADASVLLDMRTNTCSATHIGHGLYLTAAHCTESGPITVVTTLGTRAQTGILWVNKGYDIALLSAGLLTRSADVNCKDASVGDAITIKGNPLGYNFVTTKGTVISTQFNKRLGTSRKTFMSDASVAPGNSGGAAFDRNGRIVGVVSAMWQPFRYAFIVPSSVVCQLLGRG